MEIEERIDFYLDEGKKLMIRKGIKYSERINKRKKAGLPPIEKMARVEKPSKEFLQVGDKVKILRGSAKGKIGKVVDYSREDDQIDVKVGNKMRYLGFNDIKMV